MIYSIIGKMLESKIMTDNPTKIMLCLNIGIILIIIATILSLIYHLNEKLHQKKLFSLIPLGIYIIVILLAIILSKNYEVINTWNLF